MQKMQGHLCSECKNIHPSRKLSLLRRNPISNFLSYCVCAVSASHACYCTRCLKHWNDYRGPQRVGRVRVGWGFGLLTLHLHLLVRAVLLRTKKDASVPLTVKKGQKYDECFLFDFLELILFNFHTDFPTRKSAQQGVTFRTAFRPHVFAHLSVCDRRQAALQRMLTQRGLQEAAGLHIGGEATRSILDFHDFFSQLCFCFRLYCSHMCNLCCQALCEARVVPHIEGRMFVCLSEPKTC